jgi:hypothetical protein
MDLPGGTGQMGKPWIEILFSSLSGNQGTALNQALQETRSSNPPTQTQLLATSTNVHEAGPQSSAEYRRDSATRGLRRGGTR